MGIDFLPYIEQDGAWTMKDSDIMNIFDRIEAQRLKDVVFYEFGGDREWFLDIMKNGENQMYVVFDHPSVAGIVWLNRFEGRSARLHFCFLQGYGGDYAIEVARKWLEIVLNKRNMYDVLVGVTPVKNKAAIGFLKKVGVTVAAVIPNYVYSKKTQQSEPAMMSYFTKENLR